LNENGGSNTIDISGNISNPEGDVLTTTITIPPDHGTATTDGSGNIVYNPEPGFTGTDTFTYQVCDNGSPSLCVTGTVKIEVTAIVIVNRVPEIVEISKTMVQNETILFEEPDFNSAFTDADNDKLVKVRIVSLPVSGSLRLNGIDVLALQEIPGEDLNSLEYISEPGFSGEMIFSWQASDGKDYSLTTYVRITVTPLEVFVPEGFSPNGDGINDYFVIKGADVNVVILSIFNRWGNLVYESKHYQNDWDGVANAGLLVSSKLPDGTYYYIIDFNNGEKSGIGYITINR
jgi:gliding motility-associated-like protein